MFWLFTLHATSGSIKTDFSQSMAYTGGRCSSNRIHDDDRNPENQQRGKSAGDMGPARNRKDDVHIFTSFTGCPVMLCPVPFLHPIQ